MPITRSLENDYKHWIHLDLNCYSCNLDIRLAPQNPSNRQRLFYCSVDCTYTLPLSTELVITLYEAIERGVYHVPALEVAQAILDWDAEVSRTIRSLQWRERRVVELELAIQGL